MKWDPAGTEEAARAALDRGPGLHDLPILALAASRVSGILAEELAPWARLWEELPGGATADLDGLGAVFDLANLLSTARREVARRRYKTVDERASEEAERQRRIREVALATPSRSAYSPDLDARTIYERARTRVEGEEADVLRRLEADVALLERRFADQLRVVWAAVRTREAAR